MALVAGVDSSTQSTKVEVRDLDTGVLVASGHAPHPPTSPPRSEQDPSSWWTAFGEAWAMAGAPHVAAISVAGQQHGMVVLDAAGAVVRPAKLWNDTESALDSEALVAALGGGAGWAAAVGSVPVASFTITKLAWLRRSEPDAWERVARVLLPHDWLTLQLTGAFVTDRGDASGTGYWSPASGHYRHDLLALVDPDRAWDTALPRVLGPAEAAGSWNGAMVGPGTGDNMAAALGLGLRPGDTVVSLGTSGTAFTVSGVPSADATGSVAGFADATGRYLPLVCTLNATKVTAWVAGLLGASFATLDDLALESVPGARGAVLLPYLDGERTPNRPDAHGVLAGLGSATTPSDVARAAFEGVLCGLADALDALRDVASLDGRLFLVGGGARSRAYRRLAADLFGRPCVVPDTDETVATGACVQAASTCSGTDPMEVARTWGLGSGTTIEPGPDAASGAAVRAAYRHRRDRES